jgi:uncharacterized membrane protein (UPF0127 family)
VSFLATTSIALLSLSAASCAFLDGDDPETGALVRFSSTDQTLTVRVADSDGERRDGLMGVEELEPDSGMAFVFEEPTSSSFWMKDTLIPLSIAFVDGQRIVGIEEMTPCTADPCPTWDAGGAEYTLALEANAGWFAEHGVSVGDSAELSGGRT